MNSEKKVIPPHIGIIMDGNRRWAGERNLASSEGHIKGYQKLKVMPEWFFNVGVETVSVFAFSTENWNRHQDEVNFLMKLIKKAFTEDFEEFDSKGYKLMFSGRIEELPGDLSDICLEAEAKSKTNSRGMLNICINYGGRAEIVDAIKKMIKNNIGIEQVHEGMVKKYLYQPELSAPDMIVRTSGEQRLSGFQLWESTYAEFLFLSKYWPDFEKSDVDVIIDEYSKRKRRFGGDDQSS